MAGDVKVGVATAQLSSLETGTTDFTITDFGTPKACIVILGFDGTDNASVAIHSRLSIGFSDFINDYCIAHQDEDASTKVDCDAIKSDTKCYIGLDAAGNVLHEGTADTITDGVRLTNTSGAFGPRVTVVMFGGADLTVDVERTAINSSVDGEATINASGTDGNDRLIFFIGTDIGAEDSASTGINNSFGVAHITGTVASHTITQRAIGWSSDHNNINAEIYGIASTDRVLDILTETGGQDWGLEVTALASANTITVTTRDNGAGAGMEVYSLALDLDDRSASVGTSPGPTTTADWVVTGLGWKPQYVGLHMHRIAVASLDTIISSAQADQFGISSNDGTGETFHGWMANGNTGTTDTNNIFRSRVADLRSAFDNSVIVDMSHSSFDSGGWTYTVNTENESTAAGLFHWAIEEAAGAGPPGFPDELLVNSLFDPTQLRM